MGEIRHGLGTRADAVALGHCAPAEAAQLREDEPHPVAALSTARQLRANLRPHRRLRGDESLEAVRIGVVVHANLRGAQRCGMSLRR